MHVTILNLTDESLVCFDGASSELHTAHRVVLPGATTETDLGSCAGSVTLVPLHLTCKPPGKESISSESHDGVTIRITKHVKSAWQMLPLPEDFCWRIFRIRCTKKLDRLLILPRRDLSTFLSETPDTVPLSAVVLPGTHDTMAFYGWPISQCQSEETPLETQLQSGIRVLDIRLAVVKSRLIAYHGLYPERASFQEILATIHEFLTAPFTCHETLVMSIKQEDFAKTPPLLFSEMVQKEILASPLSKEMWFLEDRVPLLGEVRGKVVMFSRFGGDGSGSKEGLPGLGMHPTNWPDSEKFGFTWGCKKTLVRTHDWYNIPSFLAIPEKTDLATNILLPPPNNPPIPNLSITYFSAASFPLAFPPVIAKGWGWPRWNLGFEGVNERVVTWLLQTLTAGFTPAAAEPKPKRHSRRPSSISVNSSREPRIRGWVFIDFYSDPANALVPLLVECNFRGRRNGDEGWS